MIGTLACDAVVTHRSRGALLFRLFGWGAVLMALGWLASCVTRMYDIPAGQIEVYASAKLAKDPVVPSSDQVERWKTNFKEHRWSEVLAEPPFVPPPHSHDPDTGKVNKQGLRKTEDKSDRYRKWNYWMMSQRAGSISYLTFAAGFSLVVYGLFYILADMLGIKVGMFRTFGTNALVGYILHDFTGDAIKNFIPPDSPPMVMWASVAFFFSSLGFSSEASRSGTFTSSCKAAGSQKTPIAEWSIGSNGCVDLMLAGSHPAAQEAFGIFRSFGAYGCGLTRPECSGRYPVHARFCRPRARQDR